jgi:hypothetical protein
MEGLELVLPSKGTTLDPYNYARVHGLRTSQSVRGCVAMSLSIPLE